MIDFFLGLFEFTFIVLMLGLLTLFLGSLLVAWTWAHRMSLAPESRSISLSEVLTIAGVEWGALVTLIACHWSPLRPYFESPKFEPKDLGGPLRSTQLPVVLVPSLHLGNSVFRILFWRLKSNYFKSLWPFAWKSFLNQSTLLEDQLSRYLETVFEKTGSDRAFVISFGSSRPLVSRVLSRPRFSSKDIRWFCVSGPSTKPETYTFISTPRLKSAFSQEAPLDPQLLIVGERDTVAFPQKVFGDTFVSVPDVGHYGVLLHSRTVQSLLDALESDRRPSRMTTGPAAS